nr:ABC transporter substrate-binding protein [Rathayibacter sp. VKM Ac-2630]
MLRSSAPLRTALALTGASLLGLTACAGGSASSPSSSGSETVGMGIQPWLGYGPWYVADEKGYFEDEDVDVSITSFMNDADMSAAFASDRIQVANVASHTALQLAEQGLDISIVLLLDASLTADAILTDGSITDVADLAGKDVAFEEGSVSNLLLATPWRRRASASMTSPRCRWTRPRPPPP